MKRIASKILALTLTATMLLSNVQTIAYAGESSDSTQLKNGVSTALVDGDYTYAVLTDGTISIDGYTGSATELDIPDTIDGKSVTSIAGGSFMDNTSLVTVTIPSSVVSLGSHAFSHCTNLENVVFQGATSISNHAFGNCTKLKNVTMEKVTSIAEYAFYYCTNLVEITIPTGVTNIGNNTFYYCTNLSSITIPASVTTIGTGVFTNCANLTIISPKNSAAHVYAVDNSITWQELEEVVIPYTYKELDDGTLEITGYTGVDTEIEIPSSIDGKTVTSIGATAFGGRTELTSVIIPNTIMTIGNHAFTNCTGLTSIVVPSRVTSIENGAFSCCNKLARVTLLDGLKSIGDSAFTSCISLTAIEIPDSVTTIGANAFSGCLKLVEITIPSGVTSIADETFAYCEKLASVDIYSNVTSIGARAFENCRALTEIVLPDNLVSVGNLAFNLCSGLTVVTIPENVTSMGTNVFLNCSALEEVYCPSNTAQWQGVDDTVTWYEYRLLDDNTVEFAYYFGNKTSVEVPNTIAGRPVTSIGARAFEGHSELTSIQIPDCVINIGESAFVSCAGLTEFRMPASLTSIGDNAFNNCNRLENIELPNGVIHIGTRAFINCLNMTSITIPSAVTSIGDEVFTYCDNLTISCPKNSTAHTYAIDNNIAIKKFERSINGTITYSKNVEDIFVLDAVLSEGFGTLSYVCDNTAVAEVDTTGKVTIVGEGTAIITVAAPETSSYKEAALIITITAVKKSVVDDPEVDVPDEDDDIKDDDSEDDDIEDDDSEDDDIEEDDIWEDDKDFEDDEDDEDFEDDVIKVEKITLSHTSVTLKKGKSVVVTAIVTPDDADDTEVIWRSSNEKVATVNDDGKIVAKGYGTATITAEACDDSGVKATCKITVGYTITYKLNNGTNNKNNPSTYYNQKITLKSPTRKGYTFKGWYTDKKFKNKITTIKKSAKKNYTLYAKWERVSVKKTSISSAKNSKGKKIALKYKKSSAAAGYEITYSTDKKFKKSVTRKTSKKTTYTIKSLKKGKTYYVKVRAYKLDSTGKKVYSGYSKVVKVKIKK